MSQSNRPLKDKYLDSLKSRYAEATKKERGKILDEYVQTTRYHRKHAIAILSGRYQSGKHPIHRPRKTIYTAEDAKALAFLSDLFDGINAKLLRAAMDAELEPCHRRGVLQVSRRCYRRLKHISPASIDRLRARYGPPRPTSRHRTKPGTLLKSQIPIRTWADWNEDQPGFVEMDLVGHDGGNLRGDYCLTLDFTDGKKLTLSGTAAAEVVARKSRSRGSSPACASAETFGARILVRQWMPSRPEQPYESASAASRRSWPQVCRPHKVLWPRRPLRASCPSTTTMNMAGLRCWA
jgi:hypothetical protein